MGNLTIKARQVGRHSPVSVEKKALKKPWRGGDPPEGRRPLREKNRGGSSGHAKTGHGEKVTKTTVETAN